MKLTPPARRLYDDIAQLRIIDAHEHLPPEKEYLEHGYCGLNMFAHYIIGDLRSAGIPEEFASTMRTDVETPAQVWWPKLKPYWECVRNTSYARALLVTARDCYGINDINDDTIAAFAEKVKADNTSGLYKRVLQDTCGIRCSITCWDHANFPDDPGIRAITRLFKFPQPGRDMIAQLATRTGRRIRTLDDAVEATQSALHADLEAGAVGFKTSSQDYREPDARAAETELKKALKSPEGPGRLLALRDYLFDKALDIAAEADVPVAVHTGYWGDFRTLDPKFMLGFAVRRPDVRFDMFHLGSPMYRDAALIGKTQPNVTVNLVWCAIISQVQTARMLDELIDLVPVNKIIAFGGDYGVCVQNVYGHLVLARQVVASVLARRIDQGDFDREYALHLAKLWFRDNPARVYRI